MTGGNITISNNISYLVPEELGAVNVPIEHVTGGRTANGSFTCYLTLDTDGTDKGTSVDLFNDMTTVGGGLDKVVNNFDVTFQVGGAVAALHVFKLIFQSVTLTYLRTQLKMLFLLKLTLVHTPRTSMKLTKLSLRTTEILQTPLRNLHSLPKTRFGGFFLLCRKKSS